MIWELISAAVGTVAFSLLFGVPKKYYVHCGCIGAAGWFLYKVMLVNVGLSIAASVFFATVLVVLLSRYAAVFEKCPATVFMITGIFPLVPGAQIYWATYYLVTDNLYKAFDSGFLALKIMIAIVLGIVVVFEIPYKFFKIR
ncbi:MAG: threonine/serine exporter family protein [Lachnospiraceae bacterium]|nr:threonine/serine exporter family protein [Lachnospiraceae bacterium]